eukprot:11206008-Karenia_brevis.AAC.1
MAPETSPGQVASQQEHTSSKNDIIGIANQRRESATNCVGTLLKCITELKRPNANADNSANCHRCL